MNTTTAIISDRINAINEASLLNIANNEALTKEKNILDAALSQLLSASDDEDDEPPSEEPHAPCTRTLSVQDAIDEAHAKANSIVQMIGYFTRNPELRNVVNGRYVSIDYLKADLEICKDQLQRLNKELQ